MYKPLTIIVFAGICLNMLSGCAGLMLGGAATGVAVAHDRRTAGTVVEDQSIEFKAVGGLHADEEIQKQTHLNVTSFNNSVLLSGEAPTEELRHRAGEIVRRVEKVRRVYNEVAIAAPSSLMSRSNDTLITAKVKTKLFGIKGQENFDATRVKVVTENGTVFLMGLLRHAEAAAVIDVARQVKGVLRVVKLFEYLD